MPGVATRRIGCWMLVALSLTGVAGAQDLRLVEAAKRQDNTAVRALLQQGADVNARQPHGATALHWAVHWDDLETTDRLLRAGANANAANQLGVTPLSLACSNGNAALVERLLKAGADPATAAAGVPPIMTCARTGSSEAVEAMIARGANVNATEPARQQTALMWAVAQGHADTVRVLLERGAAVHIRSRVTQLFVNRASPNDTATRVIGEISRGRSTALLFAARQGSVESTRLLLDAGARVDDVDAEGSSALVVAAHSNHAALATLLLDRGANPNVIGAGYTALHAAVLRGNATLVSALIAHGANVNARLRHGTTTTRGSQDYFLPESLVGATPFLLAAKFLEVDIMRMLIASGADIHLTLNDGTTPLIAAAGVPVLPPQFDRRERLTALRSSDEPLALEAVTLLLDRGAAINAANERGDTALHGTAARNYTTVLELLVARGARLDVKNTAGKTPLAVATGASADLLRKLGATN